MNNQLPEEELSKLLPGLSSLAKRIGTRTEPDWHVLEDILLSIGVQREEWALQELELWAKILEKVPTASNDDERAAIVRELQERGVPEAPAILAVNEATRPPLMVEPESIDFGLLKLGEGANATLKVSGKLIQAIVHNNRLKVTSLNLSSENSLIKVMLLAGSAGESLQGSVILKGEGGELRVPVYAQWEKEPPMLQFCPACRRESLFWNRFDRKYECLNLDCKVEGPSLDKLAKLQPQHRPY